MARIKGIAPFSASFESQTAMPTSSFYCETFADLIDASEQKAHDGIAYLYPYKKAIVFADSDNSKNGIYFLKDIANPTLANSWEKMNNNSSGKDYIFYDEIPFINYETYPAVSFEGAYSTYSPKLSSYSGKSTYWFESVYFMFVNLTTNITTKGLRFANESELVDWVNSNVGNNGSRFTERGYFITYDIIDKEIVPITKVRGYNSLFGSIIGSGGYNAHYGTALNSNWDYANRFYASLYNYFLGTAFTEADFSTSKSKRSIWLPRNYRAYYKPQMASYSSNTINYGTPTRRTCYDTINEKFINVNTVPTKNWVVYDRAYLLVQMSSSPSFDIYSKDDKALISSALANDNTFRGVIVYLYKNRTDNNLNAIQIKPMGIDSIIINYIDFSKYSLEILYKSTGEQQNFAYIDTFSSLAELSDINASDIISGRITLRLSDWKKQTNTGFMKSVGFGRIKFPNIYFRLRNKITKQVSQLSRSYIASQSNTNTSHIIPFAHIVRTDKI